MKMETRRDARRMSAIIQRLSAETGSNPDGQRAISTGKSASRQQLPTDEKRVYQDQFERCTQVSRRTQPGKGWRRRFNSVPWPPAFKGLEAKPPKLPARIQPAP